jgi:uncharacterized protein
MNSTLPYYSFNYYLKKRFNQLVWRVTLEGNFTCPNRDGSRAFGGCTFCTADGSSSQLQTPTDSLAEQLIKGIEKQAKRHKAKKFIAYLQSFTNTYAPIHYLQSIYDQAINHPDIVMLSIGTRPDCLSDEVIKLIDSYNDKVEVWLDLGLQSANNETLNLINRGHSVEEFIEAVKRVKIISPRTKICCHSMVGLPSEDLRYDPKLTKSLETVKTLISLPIDGIKIHNLCILKGTKLALDYSKGLIEPLDLQSYLDFLLKVIPIIPPEITIHRLMAEAASKDELIAPSWTLDKDFFMNELRKQLNERGLFQGCQIKQLELKN